MNPAMPPLKIYVAVQLNKAHWECGRAMPKAEIVSEAYGDEKVTLERVTGTQPGTRVTNIHYVDGNVIVWGTDDARPGRGRHFVLSKPSLAFLWSASVEGPWRAKLAEFEEDGAFRETIEEVTDLECNVWRLRGPVPNLSDFTIIRMVVDDDTLGVFAISNPGTEAANRGVFHYFQLMPYFFQRVEASAPLPDWEELQLELEENLGEEEAERQKERLIARLTDQADEEEDDGKRDALLAQIEELEKDDDEEEEEPSLDAGAPAGDPPSAGDPAAPLNGAAPHLAPEATS